MFLLQASAPFFSNDQWGLLKVLVVVVLPITLSIWGFLFRDSRRKEAHDINELGKKVNSVVQKIEKVETEMRTLGQVMNKDRLSFTTNLFTSQQSLNEQLSQMKQTLVRVEERTCNAQELREAITDGIKTALKGIKP